MNVGYRELFKNIELRTDIGIGLETLTKKILETTVRDLISDKKIIEHLLEYRSTYSVSLNKKLGELNRIEIYEYLREFILLEYMIPLISRYIELWPLMPGPFFYGEFLFIIFRIDENFWNGHRHWYSFFIDIAKDVLNNCETEELDERVRKLIISVCESY
ncbi:hypothetical protein [Clostridium sp. JS66]|uniref:hypothetical protein n=1 Tax=Clostridium sp. JS66 TaxID=3064705 RepID=UPI00298E9F3A|nr:hypothetical protein [Clostridium sp. JS66]WPC42696.1 hypothetical protein Q6H37_04280 [Clostridium sp. JS66]